MMNLEEILKYAKRNGVRKNQIGKRIWGEKQYNIIYMLKNPTSKTLNKVETTVFQIIKERKNK